MSYGLCVTNSDCSDPQQQETVTGGYKNPGLISKQSVKMPTKSTSVTIKRNKQNPINKRKPSEPDSQKQQSMAQAGKEI